MNKNRVKAIVRIIDIELNAGHYSMVKLLINDLKDEVSE